MSIADFVKTAKTAREAYATEQLGTSLNSVITANLGSGRRVYLLPEFQVKHALREHPEDILICGCYAEDTYFFAQGHAAVASTFSGLLGVFDANSG